MAGRPPFDVCHPESEDFKGYSRRTDVEIIFIVYDLKDDTDNAAKRRAILLTSIGSGTCRVLKDLSYPAASNTEDL